MWRILKMWDKLVVTLAFNNKQQNISKHVPVYCLQTLCISVSRRNYQSVKCGDSCCTSCCSDVLYFKLNVQFLGKLKFVWCVDRARRGWRLLHLQFAQQKCIYMYMERMYFFNTFLQMHFPHHDFFFYCTIMYCSSYCLMLMQDGKLTAAQISAFKQLLSLFYQQKSELKKKKEPGVYLKN